LEKVICLLDKLLGFDWTNVLQSVLLPSDDDSLVPAGLSQYLRT